MGAALDPMELRGRDLIVCVSRIIRRDVGISIALKAQYVKKVN